MTSVIDSIDRRVAPFSSDANFRLADFSRILTPALLIDRDVVQHNVATTLRLLDGDANRWRPHVKTAKLGYVMRMLVDAGVRQFKTRYRSQNVANNSEISRQVLVRRRRTQDEELLIRFRDA